MKILVTGGAGFLGGHLVEALLEQGHEVLVLDNLSRGSRSNIPEKVTFYELDINDPSVGNIFETEKPKSVFHLAANTNVPRSVTDPYFDAKSITGFLRVAEGCVRAGVKKFIFSSSGFIYGNADKYPTTETEPFKPIAPYSISKYAVEQYLQFYQTTYGLPFVILRLATVYGPRQTSQALNAYVDSIARDERTEMYGKLPKTRDYVFVKDMVRAFLLALVVPESHPDPIFNVGTSIETTLIDLYMKIAAMLGKKIMPLEMPARNGELDRFSLDYSKFNQLTLWKPEYSLDQGLEEVLKYKKLL